MDGNKDSLANDGSQVPVIDFTAYSLDKEKPDLHKFPTLVEEVHNAYTTIGFLYLKNFGIPEKKIQAAFDMSKKFFDLETDVKKNYLRGTWIKGSLHGYVPVTMESLDPSSPIADPKESFNIRPECKELDPPDFPAIPEVPEMKDTLLDLYHICRTIHQRLLEIMTIGLKLPDKSVFTKKCSGIGTTKNTTSLRSLMYPSIDDVTVSDNQLRCGEHSDYGVITLLFQDQAGGLEVRNVHNEWVQATPVKGTVLANIGDLLQRWSADKYIAAKHRVVLPSRAEGHQFRQSMAFFGTADEDQVIECIDGSNKYPPIVVKEYFTSKVKASLKEMF